MRRLTLLVTAVGAVLLGGSLPPSPIVGAPPGGGGPDGGVVVWNGDYTLAAGEQIPGDLVVFNGDAVVEPTGTVRGSVVVWNGAAIIGGTVTGDVLVSEGSIHLRGTAQVSGDVVCAGKCALSRDGRAHVEGAFVWRSGPGGRSHPGGLLTAWVFGPGRQLSRLFHLLRLMAGLSVMAAVAGLVALVWPQGMERVGRAVTETPWRSLAIGVLTGGAATALSVALTLTLCLAPLAGLVTLAVGATALLGWISIGALVGRRLLRAGGMPPAAALGTTLITLAVVTLKASSCLALVGWGLLFALGCAGLGAAVLAGPFLFTGSHS